MRYTRSIKNIEVFPGNEQLSLDVNSGSTKPAVPNKRTWTQTDLFVDNEPAILERGRSILKNYGFTIITAVNGLDAIEQIKNNPQKIIIC